MALCRVVSEIFNVQKYRNLKIQVKDQSRLLKWYHSIDCLWLPISVL